jgi:hypothetical protein
MVLGFEFRMINMYIEYLRTGVVDNLNIIFCSDQLLNV